MLINEKSFFSYTIHQSKIKIYIRKPFLLIFDVESNMSCSFTFEEAKKFRIDDQIFKTEFS